MKIKNILLSALVVMGGVFTSCETDNYEAPSYLFSGQLKCDGENFQFDSNKGLFKFMQSGYGKVDGGTGMRIDDNGHYQQLLFKADYKLTLVNQQLPFELPDLKSLGAGLGYDSIPYNINSNITQDFEIRPYYKLSNLDAKLENGMIVATFNVSKMSNTTKEAPKITRAYIYLSTSRMVNSGIACRKLTDLTDPDVTSVEVTIPLSYYRDKRYYPNNTRTYAFYRVAIELEGIPDYYLFSEIKKLENLPME